MPPPFTPDPGVNRTMAVRLFPSIGNPDEFDSEDSNLIEHARRELTLAGVMDKDSDYGGMLGVAVIDLIRLFAAQGHSGMSAHMVTQLFNQLARYEALTPLTDNPAEWLCHVEPGNDSPDSLSPSSSRTGMWQNTRQSNAFSYDGGRTYKITGEDSIMISVVSGKQP